VKRPGIFVIAAQRDGLDLKGIGWFLVIAYGIAWALALPIWLDGRGLESPWAALILAMNFAPAIATFVVVRWIHPLHNARRATGLRFGAPGTRWGLYWLFGWLAFVAFSVAAPFVGALFGLFPMDLADFSGYREALESTAGGQEILALAPIRTLALVVLLTLPLQAPLLTPFTFGEVWGWRGYLLPQLVPLGQWPALLISGAVWGLWHAPIILLGFNYPLHPVLGVFLMTIFCTIIGTILGWTRLATGSVWPAVLGHAGMNSSQVLGGVAVLTLAGAEYDTAHVFITGRTGWILPLLFIAFLVVAHRLPVRDAPDLASPANSVAASPGDP
jgi:membrane protease YdiL (CAAX protease family)